MKLTTTLLILVGFLSLTSCEKKEEAAELLKTQKEENAAQDFTIKEEESVTKSKREHVEEVPQPKAQNLSAFITDDTIGMMKNMQAQQTEKKVRDLDRLLNLTEEQKVALAEHFSSQGALSVKVMERMKNGENINTLSQELMDQYKEGDRQSIKDILTEEQYQKYQEDNKKKAVRSKEATALRELANIQSKIDMTEDQKDAVLNILHEGKYKKNLNVNTNLNSGQSALNSTDFLNASVERKRAQNTNLIEELTPVLSQDQLETYQHELDDEVENLERMNEMTKKMLDGQGISVEDLNMNGLNGSSIQSIEIPVGE